MSKIVPVPVFHKIKEYYQRNERWIPIAFFVLGFVFDIVTLSRIDDPLSIAQQVGYLLIIAALLHYEISYEAGRYRPGKWVSKVWQYREAALHFFLGALLSLYSLLFFKSAAVLTSFVFVGVLTLLLMANEFMQFGKSQKAVHAALSALCLLSFFVCLVPMVLGFIGVVSFVLAMGLSLAFSWVFLYFLERRLGPLPSRERRQLRLPILLVHLLFAILYFTKVIPPVPLSATYIGVFHGVEREGDHFKLAHMRPWWRVWESGDQMFYARPGDRIYCFASIFSPVGFKDELVVRWLYRDRRGWQSSDAIPLRVTGGRAEGYRGVTYKSNYQPGSWRVQIETTDGREIGRIPFVVVTDTKTESRTFTVDVR